MNIAGLTRLLSEGDYATCRMVIDSRRIAIGKRNPYTGGKNHHRKFDRARGLKKAFEANLRSKSENHLIEFLRNFKSILLKILFGRGPNITFSDC
jgi:hypothetical protein